MIVVYRGARKIGFTSAMHLPLDVHRFVCTVMLGRNRLCKWYQSLHRARKWWNLGKVELFAVRTTSKKVSDDICFGDRGSAPKNICGNLIRKLRHCSGWEDEEESSGVEEVERSIEAAGHSTSIFGTAVGACAKFDCNFTRTDMGLP